MPMCSCLMQAAAKGKGKKKVAMLSDDEDTAEEDSASEGEWAPKVRALATFAGYLMALSFLGQYHGMRVVPKGVHIL